MMKVAPATTIVDRIPNPQRRIDSYISARRFTCPRAEHHTPQVKSANGANFTRGAA
jgi:hypothetical protein